MVATSLRINRTLNLAARTAGAGMAAGLTLLVFLSSFRLIVQNASASLWGGAFSSWATPITLGLVSGLLIGTAVGRLFRQGARLVAIGAGLLQTLLVMSSGVYLETSIVSLAIAVGLFVGALVASPSRHA